MRVGKPDTPTAGSTAKHHREDHSLVIGSRDLARLRAHWGGTLHRLIQRVADARQAFEWLKPEQITLSETWINQRAKYDRTSARRLTRRRV
jgi:hypothetical protein